MPRRSQPANPGRRVVRRQPGRSSSSLRSANVAAGARDVAHPASSFPARARTMLLYTTGGRVNPGVVTELDTLFSLNSVFDPEVTGAGHQPREFDTWALLYGKYRVLETRAEVWIRQRASHGIVAILSPNNTAIAVTGVDRPGELPRAEIMGVSGSNQPILHKVCVYKPHAILGQTTAQYMASEDTSALVSASPTEQVYLHLYMGQMDGATVLDAEYEIRLSYMVEFYDRKVLAPSALVRMVLAGPPRVDPDDDDLVDPRAPGGGAPRSVFPPLASSGQVRAAAASATRVYPR